jgi:hypothetical protein
VFTYHTLKMALNQVLGVMKGGALGIFSGYALYFGNAMACPVRVTAACTKIKAGRSLVRTRVLIVQFRLALNLSLSRSLSFLPTQPHTLSLSLLFLPAQPHTHTLPLSLSLSFFPAHSLPHLPVSYTECMQA